MSFFPAELEIEENEGFTAEKDIFGRRAFGEQLARIVNALGGGKVILLDAPWGTGKTTFLKMWRGYLRQKGFSTIYFDAFANDYQQDGFVALAGQIVAEAKSVLPQTNAAKKSFTKKAVKVAKTLGWAGVRIGVRAATVGVVDAEHLRDAAAEIAKITGEETAKSVDKLVKERLENADKDNELFIEFRQTLNDLTLKLSETAEIYDTEEDAGTAPLVFIIDELDRCKPTFALNLLEKIKHFFSVPNVSFILVGTLAQFEAAVRYSYGPIDAQQYLEKFYHLRVSFPVGNPTKEDRGPETYLRHLVTNQNVSTIIEVFAQVHPLSFRTMEKIVAYSKILFASLGRGIFVPEIIAVLCILKVVRPDMYLAVRKGQLPYTEFKDFLKITEWNRVIRNGATNQVGTRVSQWWGKATGQVVESDVNRVMDQKLLSASMESTRLIPYYCDMIDGFSLPETEEI